MAPTPAWGLAPRVELQWRQLDEVDWVVFETGAGQMHALDPLAAAVLTLIEADAGDEAVLLAELQAHWPGAAGDGGAAPDAAAIQPLLRQTLQALGDAGLIVRCRRLAETAAGSGEPMPRDTAAQRRSSHR